MMNRLNAPLHIGRLAPQRQAPEHARLPAADDQSGSDICGCEPQSAPSSEFLELNLNRPRVCMVSQNVTFRYLLKLKVTASGINRYHGSAKPCLRQTRSRTATVEEEV